MNPIVASLCAAFVCFSVAGLSQASPSKESLLTSITADIFPFGGLLEPSMVRSASDYILISHITRSLVSIGQDTQIEGDLAESWEVNSEFTEYKFRIKKNQKFSNGDLITATDVVKTVQRQVRINESTHFDFSEVKSVRAENDVVIFTLKQTNTSFLLQTYNPEFGVLHSSDSNTSVKKAKFKITSGPYTVVSNKKNNVKLVKNGVYPFEEGVDAPDAISFVSNPTELKLSKLKDGSTDFLMTSGGILTSDIDKIKQPDSGFAMTLPHIGFSFWVSIDPRRDAMADPAVRSKVQTILSKATIDFKKVHPFWSRASQVYLPDGAGRLRPDELTTIWSNIEAKATKAKLPKKIRFLVSHNFPFSKELVSSLKENKIEVEVVKYSNQSEFEAQSKSGKFDMFQINNDFSSVDVLQNLVVTFQASRPLVIFESKNHICKKLLEKAKQTADRTERYDIYRQIERHLLEGGYVAPIAHNHIPFLHKSNLDISKWSQLFPEVSFWKSSIIK